MILSYKPIRFYRISPLADAAQLRPKTKGRMENRRTVFHFHYDGLDFPQRDTVYLCHVKYLSNLEFKAL